MTRTVRILFLLLLLASPATAAVVLQLNSPGGPTHAAGAVVPIELWLTGTRPTTITSIELALESPSSGASFVAVAPNLDGFAESAIVSAQLGTVNDGSLLDDLFLGFAAGVGVDGVPAGSESVLLGTFWVQTPADAEAVYSIGIDPSSIDVLDAGLDSVAATGAGVSFNTLVPEPVSLGVVGAAGMLLVRRRAISWSRTS